MNFSGSVEKATGATSGIVYFIKNGSTITIRPNPTANSIWNYQTSGTTPSGQISFYQAFLHEIGHLVSLQHVNGTQDLMYYTASANSPIKTITSTSAPVIGAQTTVDISKNINWPAPMGKIGNYISNVATPIIISNTGSFNLCNGSSITLSVQNTSGVTKWQWSDNSTNSTLPVSAPNDYFVRTVRNGCYKTSNPVTIEPGNLSATFTVSPPCDNINNGYIFTNVTGNNPPFSYEWTGSNISPRTTANLTGISSGNYKLVLTDSKGCSEVYTKLVPKPDILEGELSSNSDVPEALEEYVVINVTGGVGPYSYNWQSERTCPCSLTNAHSDRIPNINCSYSVTVTDQCNESFVRSGSSNNGFSPRPVTVSITEDNESNSYIASASGGALLYSYH